MNRMRFSILVLVVVAAAILAGCRDDDPTGPNPVSGTIVIDGNPDMIAFTWILSGGSKTTINGEGDSTLTDMLPGMYFLTWGDVGGWVSPDVGQESLAEDAVVTFRGVYTERPFVSMTLIPAGTFMMGSPEGELGRAENETQHEVTLTHSFFLGATEVTNAQYVELAQWALDQGYATADASFIYDAMDGSTAELFHLEGMLTEIVASEGVLSTAFPDRPVMNVTWFGAASFCDWLNMREGLPRAYDHSDWTSNGGDVYGFGGFRLPTEAEWEYACRAGSETALASGAITVTDCSMDANLDALAWYCGNEGDLHAHSVGEKSPNSWGLFDMHGNVAEWCFDRLEQYPVTAVTDPVRTNSSMRAVARGGAWNSSAYRCRSACRGTGNADMGWFNIGFRVARTSS